MQKFVLAASATAALLLASHAAGAVEMGVFAGPGCYGVANLPGFAHWLGDPAHHVTENFDQSSWPHLVSDAEWSIECYASVRSTVGLTFSIPMLPADGVSTLAKGAAGAYDTVFTHIAETLVSKGFATTIVRIGWEFNGNWQPWSSYTDNDSFIRYYQRIVTLMKSVPGARFVFEWCPNLGTGTLAPSNSYPGDDYVDIVGMDVYDSHWSPIDATPQGRWTLFVTRDYGLQWQVDFANAHGKRYSFPEWGCCGDSTGDDPYFINHVADWLKSNSYLYADYWDNNSAYQGSLSDGQYPNAAAAYIADFGTP
jgi:hypothetical protein